MAEALLDSNDPSTLINCLTRSIVKRSTGALGRRAIRFRQSSSIFSFNSSRRVSSAVTLRGPASLIRDRQHGQQDLADIVELARWQAPELRQLLHERSLPDQHRCSSRCSHPGLCDRRSGVAVGWRRLLHHRSKLAQAAPPMLLAVGVELSKQVVDRRAALRCAVTQDLVVEVGHYSPISPRRTGFPSVSARMTIKKLNASRYRSPSP